MQHKHPIRPIYGLKKGGKMKSKRIKEVTIYDDRLGIVTIDVSSLGTTQYIMLLIALEYDVGKSCSEISDYTGVGIDQVYKSLDILKRHHHVKKLKLRDIPDELRDYFSTYMGNNRVRGYYFPTKKGITYIRYILKKNNLHILLKKIPDEDALIV